jgi:uncharacterized protein (TIGR03437 family)
LITTDAPAARGEWIVLFATGLGNTIPKPAYGEIPMGIAPIEDLANFCITLDGAAVPAQRVAYAGAAPGFAGLYQINVQLPDDAVSNPEIRLKASGATSPPGLHLPLSP